MEELVLLFEEPEIYLHPKLKEKLHTSLLELAKNPNVKIIVTTHDPYFIQLASDQKIYHVLRDDDGATMIKPISDKFLPDDWRSFNEINYQVFGVNGEDYLNELYGHIESMLRGNVDIELAKKEKQNKKREYLKDVKMTTTTYIRHEIHHRTNEKDYVPEDVVSGIINLQSIITEKGY